MIRCAWCGAANYAIDSWCAGCSRHLDWGPPAAAPRRRRALLTPLVAAAGLAIVLALPVTVRLTAAGRGPLPTLPDTALRAAPAAAPATPGPPAESAPAPSPEATLAPEATPPAPGAGAPVAPSQPDVTPAAAAGDPAGAIARFYQDVSGHDFAAAAALWSSRMQARFPPSVYIDHRFAGTRQINLQAARVLGGGDGEAIVYVRVLEVLGGQTRHWVGTWQLVNTESGWLLDQPNLRSET